MKVVKVRHLKLQPLGIQTLSRTHLHVRQRFLSTVGHFLHAAVIIADFESSVGKRKIAVNKRKCVGGLTCELILVLFGALSLEKNSTSR